MVPQRCSVFFCNPPYGESDDAMDDSNNGNELYMLIRYANRVIVYGFD